MNGFLEYEIYAGIQSSSVICHGYKQVEFPDGTKIRWNQNNDLFAGLFIGTMNHHLTGKVTFTDEKNGLVAYYDYGAYTFRK